MTSELRAEYQQRFLREARAAAALSHPAIVAVYDTEVDPERDVPFIAMEFVPGRSLKDMFADELQLPPEQAFATLNKVLPKQNQETFEAWRDVRWARRYRSSSNDGSRRKQIHEWKT